MNDLDWRPPLDAFAPLAGEPYALLLHAGETAADTGWSVIAAFPAHTFEVRNGAVSIDGERAEGAPFDLLKRLARARAMNGSPALRAPFLSGLCGFAGYEMGAALEPTAAGPASPFNLPDMAFGAYDALALFDCKQRRAYISARNERAAARLTGALGAAAPAPVQRPLFESLTSNFTAEGYRGMVAEAIERIRDGNFFQANLSQQLRLEARGAIRPFDVFRAAAASDAPFGAFLQYKDGAIVSASPERFFRISPGAAGARIISEPIKGTRPRSRNPETDRALAEALLRDPKDRAENIMIADLVRNDLSRLCCDGSIREEAICALESFETVHHLVSRVSGVLREEMGAVDALMALFPCGSVTGAPKVEAMKTIAALEGVGRGPYCGAIGYIDDGGGADFSVAIRTIVVEPDRAGGRLTFPVGGGVTLRSDPQAEYQETFDKAAGFLRVLGVPEKETAA